MSIIYILYIYVFTLFTLNVNYIFKNWTLTCKIRFLLSFWRNDHSSFTCKDSILKNHLFIVCTEADYIGLSHDLISAFENVTR